MKRIFVFCLFASLLAAAPTRVLFVGNSYTYYNSLPRMMEELSQAAGLDVEVRAFTRGGATLLELELHPELRALLNESWDYVVLQEHSTLGISGWNGEITVNDPAYFMQGARLLAQRAKAANAKLVLYAPWARKNHPEFQPYLDYSYLFASRELPAAIAPVGRAWVAAREQQPSLELYDPDGSHPNATGSYIGACVIMRTIFGRPCAGLPGTLRGTPINTRGQREEGQREIELIKLKPETALLVQRAADEAAPEPGVPPPFPNVISLQGTRPKGDDLAGRWRGRVYFYGNPAAFELELKPEGADGCSGIWRLNADNGSWSSVRRIAGCRITDSGFGFTVSDPLGAAVERHTVSFAGKDLTAVTVFDFHTGMRRQGGTWTARLDAHTRSSR